MSDRQTAAIRAAATKRTAHTEARVREALSAIATSGAEVSFVAVATAARVSRQFLYSHPELRAEIEQLRTQVAAARLPARASAGDDSARHRLRAALDDNHRLRDENRLLKEELAIAHGELRELRHSRARATVMQP